MSFFKKITRKVKHAFSSKSLKHTLRDAPFIRHPFHRSTLKHLNKVLPKNLRRSWGSLKKSHKLGLSHLLGASSSPNATGYYTMSYGPSNGYVYNGRSISELM